MRLLSLLVSVLAATFIGLAPLGVAPALAQTTHPINLPNQQFTPTTPGVMQSFDVGVPFDVPTTLVEAQCSLTSPSWVATNPPTNITVSILQSFDNGVTWQGWRSTGGIQSGQTGKGGLMPNIWAPGDGLARKAKIQVAVDRQISLGCSGSYTTNP